MKTIVVAGETWQIKGGCYYAKIAGKQLRIEIRKELGYVASLCLLTEMSWIRLADRRSESELEAFKSAAKLVEYLIPDTSNNPWRKRSNTECPEMFFYAHLDRVRTLRIEADAFLDPYYYVVLSMQGKETWNVLNTIAYRRQDESCNEEECERRRSEAFEAMVAHVAMVYTGRLSEGKFVGN
ncbi:MAG TPA: hypothetical protein PLC15_22855 [Candidatus Obscuribacter sp.]|nr:hypothetical protein [Candidatus Obscuribacter sp.]HMY53405.1 hypothetical protein [Candidatus Obscuribacter sp.]HNB18246.1 hypothetical protein [Candidatus Obscuribacter sp.]HND05390.1 hypothetical protein [Candidatus Obscuribacter sp.]HND69436.1 hypothetical protein [Candidatus Obscuribacter sp.]